MGVIERKDLHLHRNIKAYYEQNKIDQWQGNNRSGDGSQYYGMKGSTRHLLKTIPLTGLYLLGQFRTTEPRLLTAARTAFAPIVNTTTLGKVVKTGLQVLRGAQQMGLVKVGLTNSYADIPITANPLKRAKAIFHSNPSFQNEVRNKYGLHYVSTDGGMISRNRETTYKATGLNDSIAPYNQFKDLIPVKIGDPDNPKNTVQLRGIISGLSDTIAPTWNEMAYAGRPDGVVSYAGYKRDLTFVIRLAATSELDLKPMYEKVNALSKYVFPSGDGLSTRFSGNLCSVTVGDYIKKELAAMISFVIVPFEDAMWETHDPDLDYPSLTLTRGPLKQVKDAIERKFAKANPLRTATQSPAVRRLSKKTPFIVPRVLDITLGFKILHNHIKTYHDAPLGTSHMSNLFDTKEKQRAAAEALKLKTPGT
tara:strand:+ start:213 stop:1478 length:1266 start_codon:yes stop_codon:yes gene_type:complete